MSLANHLIIVCGHAIWLGGPRKGYDEAEWLIESYKAGETPTFIEHIKAGVEALGKDERAILIFSGGPTRKETRISEARSYANIAAANSYFGLLPTVEWPAGVEAHPLSPIPLHPRVMLEEQALDSYYNILFSILQFWRATGYRTWPERITIVSHAFKRTRIVDGHCAAIGFPIDRVRFIGINPPNLPPELSGGDQGKQGGVVSQEKANAMQDVQLVVGQWEEDPHGISEALAGKRVKRNVWGVNQMLLLSDEERRKSGLKTRFIGTDMEALSDDTDRPWS